MPIEKYNKPSNLSLCRPKIKDDSQRSQRHCAGNQCVAASIGANFHFFMLQHNLINTKSIHILTLNGYCKTKKKNTIKKNNGK